jgi:hypothetical protein
MDDKAAGRLILKNCSWNSLTLQVFVGENNANT